MADASGSSHSGFRKLTLEFLTCLTIAVLWVVVFAVVLAGFDDYDPPSFTVHASPEVSR